MPATSEPPASRQRAVIVDDDPDIGKILGFFLTRMGYDVEVLRDGESAIAAINRAPPHIVFTDYMMPGLSGLETVAAIKHDHPDLPVVVITALEGDDLAAKFAKAGANAFVEKPFSFDTIKSACDQT